MILHYSLAIWKINDNALSLIFFVNAQRSDLDRCTVIPRLTRLEWQPKNRVKRNSRYASLCIAKKIVKKNLYNADILYYKIVLYKFFWTSSKNRVIRIRAKGNRVNRGMTVFFFQYFI